MMKTIFEKSTRDELIHRINSVSDNNKALWGKMDVSQMLRHCILYDEWILGKNNPTYKQSFMGKLFGKIALRSMIKDEKHMKQNIPTLNFLKVTDKDIDVESEKKIWIELIQEFEQFSNPDFVHDFCGKLTRQQIGRLNFKHTDHHLRQFGA